MNCLLFHSLHCTAHCRNEDLSQFSCALQHQDDYECECNAANSTQEDLNITESLGKRYEYFDAEETLEMEDKDIENSTTQVDLNITKSLGIRYEVADDEDTYDEVEGEGSSRKSLTASQSSSAGWVWPTLDFTQSTRQNLNDSHRKADTRKVNYSSCRKTYYRKAKYRKAAHRKANFISSKVNSETPIELTCPTTFLK